MVSTSELDSALAHADSLSNGTLKFRRYAVLGVPVIGKQYARLAVLPSEKEQCRAAVGWIQASSELVSMASPKCTVECDGNDGLVHSSRDESIIQYLEFNRPVSYDVANNYVRKLFVISSVWQVGMYPDDRLVPWPIIGRIQNTLNITNMWPYQLLCEYGTRLTSWPTFFCSRTGNGCYEEWERMLKSEQSVINLLKFTAAAKFLERSFVDYLVDFWNYGREYLMQLVEEDQNASAWSAHWNAYKCIEELFGGGNLPDVKDKHRVVAEFEDNYHVDLTKQWDTLASRDQTFVSLVDAVYDVLHKRNHKSGHGGVSRNLGSRQLALGEVLDAQMLARQLLIDCSLNA